ncbi:hypothetical protein [Hoylesella nanceiensis]|uniref:Uncharacterized protein n=1 Tax=Hoylesella nanceiensis TaxID=425941 RepID=A0ABS6YAR5_9BACT|nr:hypothetical protein [Hoylesella nanceiensis]MBW4768659.1 hypothetical protein [Hoylesella nanceiensis]
MMKRILIALLFVFSCIGAMAQNANEHLKFMGIPINGTLESFTQKLVAKKIKSIQAAEGVGLFNGTFAGKNDCNIFVATVPNRNIVSKVVVCLPPRETWAWLESDYNQFKQMLTSKYGEPFQHSETFKAGTFTSSDYLKISALKEGKCEYYVGWKLNEGVILLEIISIESPSSCLVRLSYYDAINSKLEETSKQDDL